MTHQMPDQTITNEPRAVLSPPNLIPGWDDDGEPLNVTDCHWSLAWGCALSFGHPDPGVEGGPLQVVVSTSDAHQRDGITVRTVTPEQVAEFGLMLLGLAGTTVTQCGMQYTNDGGATVTIEPCDRRDWRDCAVSTDEGHHRRTVITLPDGLVLTSSWTKEPEGTADSNG